MPKVRVAGFSVSWDGFGAGIEQSLSDPLGKRRTKIFQWFFPMKSFCSMHGQEGEPQVMWTVSSRTGRWTGELPGCVAKGSAAIC